MPLRELPPREPDVETLEREVRMSAHGHDIVMLDHLDQKLEQNRLDLKRYREQGMDGVFGDWGNAEPSDDETGDEMPSGRNLVLGNQTVNHITTTRPVVQSSVMGKLAKAAASLAAGALTGGGLTAALTLFGGEPKPATEQVVPDFEDTIGLLEVDRD